MTDIAMTPVESSHTTAIGHDDGWLHMHFKDGAKWRFENAAHHYDEMLKPGVSVGKYFHAHVKGKHKGEKIE